MSDISPYFQGSTAAEMRVIRRLVQLSETPEAITEFDRLKDELGDYTYWFTLSTLWVSYTGHSELALWQRLFAAERPNRAECLMKPSELAALRWLPEEIIVYRAHRPGETDWIAYTLDFDIAAKRFAVQRSASEIKAYRVKRKDVLAFFLRREEMEVLV